MATLRVNTGPPLISRELEGVCANILYLIETNHSVTVKCFWNTTGFFFFVHFDWVPWCILIADSCHNSRPRIISHHIEGTCSSTTDTWLDITQSEKNTLNWCLSCFIGQFWCKIYTWFLIQEALVVGFMVWAFVLYQYMNDQEKLAQISFFQWPLTMNSTNVCQRTWWSMLEIKLCSS